MKTVEEKIIDYAKTVRRFQTSMVSGALKDEYSRQYLIGKLGILVSRGDLIKSGLRGAHVFYATPENAEYLHEDKKKIKKRFINIGLKEHEILESLFDQAPFLNKLDDNIRSIFDYAFSEMLNNAIEHSKSKNIEIEVSINDKYLSFIVRDFGIGVFRNVMQKRKLSNEFEAIQDLLKGKVTTEPRSHSGEGIFFTSKVADVFSEESYEYRLRIDNVINDVFIEDSKKTKGTKVTFKIGLDSKKHLNDVFKKYQSDPGNYAFDKTEVLVKLYKMGTVHVSRSQARRVLSGLEKFKKIVMDFDDVPTIGQAFADEVFRVFLQNHPEISIEPINMSETVRFMVERVEKIQPELNL